MMKSSKTSPRTKSSSSLAKKTTRSRPEAPAFVLPDVLAPSLDLVFCGTAAGKASAVAEAYYAHPGNRFWRTVHAVGLTPRQFHPHEFREMLRLGIGLTDLAKFVSGNDDELPKDAFDAASLRKKIVRFRPKTLAFTSKNAARAFFDRAVDYGLQAEKLGDTSFFVLPSPSGQAVKFFDLEIWRELANLIRASRGGQSSPAHHAQ